MFRVKYPQVPWKDVVALRNILAHEYFGVSVVIVCCEEGAPFTEKDCAKNSGGG
ncbi:HepT-like ribonuclease domain-containing protein [Thermovibrio sp.]